MVICLVCFWMYHIFLFKQKTAYEMRISDWSSDVCSSDLRGVLPRRKRRESGDVPEAETHRRAAGARRFRHRLFGARLSEEGAVRQDQDRPEIGRASCRERVCQYV